MLGGLVVLAKIKKIIIKPAACILTAVLLCAFAACSKATPPVSPSVLLSLPAADMSCAPSESSVSAKAAVLMESSSGQIIWEKSPNVRMPMASTTKIMTALVALERYDLDKTVRVSPSAVGIEGSSVYLYAGEELTMRDLLYALLLSSANDAAAAIAIEIGGSIEKFADLMNKRAFELGLTNTHFDNPHGLDGEAHYTTARELALITREAMKIPEFREVVSTKKRVIPLDGDTGARLLINHNKLLRYYDGCIGVKTGFTKKSGRCLVSASQKDGVEYICVTLNAPSDWNDHKTLFDYASTLYERADLCDVGEYTYSVPLVNCDASKMTVSCSEAVSVILPKGHEEIEMIAELEQLHYGGVKKGEALGRLIFMLDGNIIGESPLTAQADANEIKYKFNLLEWFSSLF